jgi:hypothetical protein
MTKAAKTRVLLLLLATLITLVALTPPKPAQACFAFEIDQCQQVSNGAWCQWSDCPQYNQCVGDVYNCGYIRTTCCPRP